VPSQGSGGREDFQRFDGGIRGEEDRLHYRFGDRFGGHHFFAGGLGPEGGPDVGVGGAGEQGDGTDAAGAKFFPESAGQTEGSVLGGVVGGGSGEDAVGGDGEIIHDSAAALHEGERGLGDEKCAGEVGFEDVFPDGEWELFNGQIWVRDADVVDENVEALEFPARGAEEGVDGVRVADVAGMGQDFDSWGGQFPADFRERFLVACGEDQVAGFGG